jgi:hypothetical protein
LDYILINFDVKTSDMRATALTCLLLDPEQTTSLGKRSYAELMKDSSLQRAYNLMLSGIAKKIE